MITNWYIKYLKFAQVETTDEDARSELYGRIEEQLKNEIFPAFANEISAIVVTNPDIITQAKMITQVINTYVSSIPITLGLPNVNQVSLKEILNPLSKLSASLALSPPGTKNTSVWTILYSQNGYIVDQYISEFFRSVYTPTPEEIQSLKLQAG